VLEALWGRKPAGMTLTTIELFHNFVRNLPILNVFYCHLKPLETILEELLLDGQDG